MLPSKKQTIQFLNNELRARAVSRGGSVIEVQSGVEMSKVASVKIKHVTSSQS